MVKQVLGRHRRHRYTFLPLADKVIDMWTYFEVCFPEIFDGFLFEFDPVLKLSFSAILDVRQVNRLLISCKVSRMCHLPLRDPGLEVYSKS